MHSKQRLAEVYKKWNISAFKFIFVYKNKLDGNIRNYKKKYANYLRY